MKPLFIYSRHDNEIIHVVRSLFSNKLVVKDGMERYLESEIIDCRIEKGASAEGRNPDCYRAMCERLYVLEKTLSEYRKLQPQGEEPVYIKHNGMYGYRIGNYIVFSDADGQLHYDVFSSVGQDRQVLTPLRCGKCGTGENLNKFACPTDGKTYCKNCVSGQDRQKGGGNGN